jgi:hypothetical protein
MGQQSIKYYQSRGGVMAKLNCIASAKKISSIIVITSLMLFVSFAHAQAADRVTTYKDANGWKLKVNQNDFYVKGVVWGHSPRGQNYTYNLWGESDEFVKAVLDHDFGLMAKAGVTANRSFTIIPPKWVTYIYQQHGIMSIVNPLMGRYGSMVGGVWRPFTDYSDELTRQTLKADVLATVERFKDVPGVLMFALGNESNYGLSWSSFEIENLPVGEQNREKAKFLYSLYGEVISAAKAITPTSLFTIVNGDLQYLDLIAEYVQDIDVLGINVYRGISFTDLWKDVDDGFDRPVLFFEFGSDAFNSKNFAEDEAAQASFLKGQWQEMYNESYGNGGYGNAIGGFVFEWRDEWWKYKQTENLDTQDRHASWSNGGYTFDFIEGQNNMNEEWFGITRIGELNPMGFYETEPRMAYYVLAKIWDINPYSASSVLINETVRNIDMDTLELRSDIVKLKSVQNEAEKFKMVGGSISGDFIVKGRDNDVQENGEDGLRFTDGQMAFLDFEFEPSNRIKGDFTLNLLGNVSQSDFEFRYGDRGLPVTVEVINESVVGVTTRRDTTLEGRERIEIYDYNAIYEGENYNVEAFYHVPRFHWGYEGDFFGLLRETTDIEGQDIWNAKAPYGVEYAGKHGTEGLKIAFGPEVYWGANPLVMLKYEFDVGATEMAFMHSEDIARRDDSSSATEATSRQSRQTSIYAKRALWGGDLEVGGLMASTEKIGDSYDRLEGNNVVVDEIKSEDTFGLKIKYSQSLFGSSQGYIGLHYAGLVANAGDTVREFGTELPYSALGNKAEVDGGILITAGDYSFYPRFLVRENLVNANPNIAAVTTGTELSPGIDARNQDNDPFAVLDNREAKSAELVFTYDPTPATSFYHWNADVLEDASFAYNIGLTVTEYNTATDAELFFFEAGGTNASFGQGLTAEDVYLLRSKMIFNPGGELSYVINLDAGKQQSTGKPGEKSVDFAGIETKVIANRKHIYAASIRVDDFGPYDFQRQFNLTYPLQAYFQYTLLLDNLRDELLSSKFGVKLLYRELDINSPAEEFDGGNNDYMFEVQTFYKYSF